jgi:hypothetical protein
MYANIDDIPITMDEVASILVFRALHKIALIHWGITETPSVSLSPIGV